MKNLLVKPSKVRHQINIPSSKSQTHRAILLASLAEGHSKIYHPLHSPDTVAMTEACKSFGAKIVFQSDHLEIEGTAGKIAFAEDVIQANNSGIILRFVSAIATLCKNPIVITGDYSIRHQRPMSILINALKELGVEITSTKQDGFAPLIIQGPLKSYSCTILNGQDSQNISALLLLGIFLKQPLEILVNNPGEKPWIDLTLDWLKRLNVPYTNEDYKKFKVEGIQTYPGFNYSVPGDWSSAAFPIAAALLTQSDLTLCNLDFNDLQGDKKIIDHLSLMGAKFEKDMNNGKLTVCKTSKLKGIEIDINECIDSITILSTLACFAEGETLIYNGLVARQKECDRIASISKELRKMGAQIEEREDGLLIKQSQLKGTKVNSCHDHRMAMSLVIAGLASEGDSIIENVDCISKTYPTFIEDFSRIGASIEEI